MIVPYRRPAGAVANIVQLAADGVAADVRLVARDRGARSYVYRLRIASAYTDVAGRLVGLRRDGSVDDLGGVAVASGSLGGAQVAVGAAGRRAYRSIHLEIRGPRIALRVEAPPLPAPRLPLAVRGGIWCIGAGGAIATVAAGVVAVGTAHRAAAPVTPAPVVAAATPRAEAPLRLAPPPAHISALSARRERDGAEDVVSVAYLAVADGGSVTLVDPAGIPLRRAPFARDGVARFVVPPAYRRSPVVAKIAVRRGTSDAVASVALVAPPDAAALTPSAAPQPATAAVAPATTSLIGVDGAAIAGRAIRVHVGALTRGGRLELQDAGGATIDAADVAPGVTHVNLKLPPGAASAFLVARYDRNGAEETIVQPIAVRPK